MRDSFIMYRSYVEALMFLPDAQRLRVLDAIMRYGLNGEEPNFSEQEKVEKAFFILIRPQLQANNIRYENGKKGAEYGSLGGRPPKSVDKKPQENPEITPNKPQENPTETPNENVNVNENVNENVCENARAREDTPMERFLKRWGVNSNAIGNYSGGKLDGIDWDKVSARVERSTFLQQQKAIGFYIAHYADILDGKYDDIRRQRAGPGFSDDEMEAKKREYDELMRRMHGNA